MMRFAGRSIAAPAFTRGIAGVAPVLYFPPTGPKRDRAEQVSKNTEITLELIRKFKGKLPAPYTRRHTTSFEEAQKEIEILLSGAAKMRKASSPDQPMDKISLMERCLRHAVWSFAKEEGAYNFAEMEKWLVYTPTDTTKLAQLKRDSELKVKYETFKKRRAEEGGPNVAQPKLNLEDEYKSFIDREIIVEKRLRYDTLAVNTTERDEAQVEALLKSYRQPIQDQRLDALVALLEKFKPVLAREAIMQRLTIKHLEGQLGVWRYLDWCPEVRDRAELEADNYAAQWFSPCEESRMTKYRLKSPEELKGHMEKLQAAKFAEIAAANPVTSIAAKGAKGKDNAAREKLLKEVLALQASLHKKEVKEETKAAAAH